eukprot:TRINITY_DN3555_c0_g1_i1.p3 TRINITY_DN3555_c0_g1~~TRINITY_DN3555_c0_g1_i1.p3  ORF type:complete len:109 (-),score=6.24 TRINITY_DN3555_c0_g1_i1:109-435(-)
MPLTRQIETGTCSRRSTFRKGSCNNCPLLLMVGLHVVGVMTAQMIFLAFAIKREKSGGAFFCLHHGFSGIGPMYSALIPCLLYTSDAADDMQCVDLGGRRIIKKKKTK